MFNPGRCIVLWLIIVSLGTSQADEQPNSLPHGLDQFVSAGDTGELDELLRRGTLESEQFRQQLLRKNTDHGSWIEALARATVLFCDQAESHLQGRRSVRGFVNNPLTIVRAVAATDQTIDGELAYGGFSGRWYGLWDGMKVDHHWGPFETLPQSRIYRTNDGRSIRLKGYQYAWVGDAYGVNLLCATNRDHASSDFLLGYVVHVRDGDVQQVVTRRPHVGVMIGKDRLIWITAGELFLEERYRTPQGEDAYAITGFFYTRNGGTIKVGKCFQAIYDRDPSSRIPWFGFHVGAAETSVLPILGTLTREAVASWPEQIGLSDVLTDARGQAITSADPWMTRRDEIKQMIQSIEYGHLPPRPHSLRANVTHRTTLPQDLGTDLRVTLEWGEENPVTMRIAVYVPPGDGPFPTIVREDVRLAPEGSVPFFLEHGYLFVQYLRTDLDPDEANQVGAAQSAYPDDDFATIGVWAWGAMRVVDYLESRDDVDLKRIAVTGHSRGGKAALLAGAMDSRFSLVAPNGSGCGGAGAFRIMGPKAETLELITREERFGYWFHPRLRWFAGQESRLPFDQHHVKALVAPRGLICLESRDDLWANPRGSRATSLAAQSVFDLLGASQRNAIHVRTGPHNWTPTDWQALHQFAQWIWFDKTPSDPERFSPFLDSCK